MYPAMNKRKAYLCALGILLTILTLYCYPGLQNIGICGASDEKIKHVTCETLANKQ